MAASGVLRNRWTADVAISIIENLLMVCRTL
ncbi:MAG: hypothetical protein QG616_2463, partial [Pseudomonadota bacterium]|nr:hypothetical protein [Pseudomonadota bacterium]